jgi:two-component system sensor histidine kinase BarA
MGDGSDTSVDLADLAVLAVDDHEINRHFIDSALRSRVASLSLARNGQEALEAWRGQHFDIVLMDLHMPDMDGPAIWRTMLQHRPDDRTRIIAMTADRRPEESRRLQQAGFHGFLSKPVSVELLIHAVVRAARKTDAFVSFEQAGPHRTALLDLDRAAEASGGANHAAELFLAFLPELESTPGNLEQLLADRRYTEAAELVHKLRGAAGYVGAARLQAACELLEESLRRELDSSPGTLLVHWKRVVGATRVAMRRQLEPA